MVKPDADVEFFAKFVGAIDPWLAETVLVGGWAHRLYRSDPRARNLDYSPLTTLDGDLAIPAKLKTEERTLRQRLIDAGFREEFAGEDSPPATHYHYGPAGGFYVEFLTPLVGSEYDRKGKRKATQEVGGVSSQQLRYIEVLMIRPWKIELGEANGYPFEAVKRIQVTNPASFLTQKILIHHERDYKDRAKDLLYIHDTIELFSEHLGELCNLFTKDIQPTLHARRNMELTGAADSLFGKVDDTIREAVLMAAGRRLRAEALAETSRAGLREIFVRK
ncbi:MAG: hypothetical protein QOG55_1118 [Acidobacteriaceae bacterium]|jgi:hypothetical protein|nr:hypothetical protein [Acidobacteriaceae bacterium]